MQGLPRRSARAVVASLLVGLMVGLVGALAVAVGRGRTAVRDVPISPVTADWFVGPDFVHRSGLTTGDPVDGELDDLSTLTSDTFDPAELDPDVRRFYERTGEYSLRYRTTWHPPFRTGAALASRLTHRVQQLALPGPDDESWHGLESEFLAVEEPGSVTGGTDRPRREDVRAWTRTDPETGAAVFVALYATHERDGERLVNIAAPFPGGNVSTVLRPELLDDGTHGPGGIRLTTDGGDDAGLYLRTPFGPVKLPAGQEFRVWRSGDGTLGAVHEMWLLGRRFLTVDYELAAERRWEGRGEGSDADESEGADDPTQTRTSTS
jgi:hypothetical protein